MRNTSFRNPSGQPTLGLRIRFARERLGLTIEQLAQRLALNGCASLQALEEGRRSGEAAELVRLTDALGQDLEFFLSPFSVVGEAEYHWRLATPAGHVKSFEPEPLLQRRVDEVLGTLRWLWEHYEPGALPSHLESCAETVGIAESLKGGPKQKFAVQANQGCLVLYLDSRHGLGGAVAKAVACRVRRTGGDGELMVLLVDRESGPQQHAQLVEEGCSLLNLEDVPTPGAVSTPAQGGLSGSAALSPRLFSPEFVGRLHRALDRGGMSARKAAKLLGLSLFELDELFPTYGLASPLDA